MLQLFEYTFYAHTRITRVRIILPAYVITLLQFIEAANLEHTTLMENPVSYHEAWQQLCKSK